MGTTTVELTPAERERLAQLKELMAKLPKNEQPHLSYVIDDIPIESIVAGMGISRTIAQTWRREALKSMFRLLSQATGKTTGFIFNHFDRQVECAISYLNRLETGRSDARQLVFNSVCGAFREEAEQGMDLVDDLRRLKNF